MASTPVCINKNYHIPVRNCVCALCGGQCGRYNLQMCAKEWRPYVNTRKTKCDNATMHNVRTFQYLLKSLDSTVTHWMPYIFYKLHFLQINTRFFPSYQLQSYTQHIHINTKSFVSVGRLVRFSTKLLRSAMDSCPRCGDCSNRIPCDLAYIR